MLPAAVLGAAVVAVAAPAQAFAPVTYGYNCASNNRATDCAIAEAQFKTTVSQVAADLVKFTFSNIGSQQVVMTNIYFEDTLPKSLARFIDFDYSGLTQGQQVSYSEGGSPDSPPSVNGFEVFFSASPNTPQPIAKGIGVGESLGLIFQILPGFDDPINAVINDLQNGSLRTAVRAQAFASGGSETLVNEEVPEPLTILGSAAAIGGGMALKRRAGAKADKKKALAG